ncbi:MAG TPA: hypothetical protein VFY12_00070 [Arenimonas sp.]|nr:hypothetical protein [Arenimonas sp.]
MATPRNNETVDVRRPTATLPVAPYPVPARRAYRPRSMGVGYGRSSGWASDRHYADLSEPVLAGCR